MNEDPRWQRVHALLDAREDPLLDPAVSAWLADDHAALATVVSLRARLQALPRSHRRGRPRASPRASRRAAAAALVVAALAVAAAVGAEALWGGSRPTADRTVDRRVDRTADRTAAAASSAAPTTPALAPLPAPAHARDRRVLHFTASSEVLGDGVQLAVSRTDGTLLTEQRTRWAATPERGVHLEVCVLEVDPR